MKKTSKHFAKVDEYRDRFRKQSTAQLIERQNSGYRLIKEAAIALREVLAERERTKPVSEE